MRLPLLNFLNKRPALAAAAKLLMLCLPFLVLPGSAHAQCDDKQTTMEMTNCMDGEVKRADAELNRAYQAALTAEQALEEMTRCRAWWSDRVFEAFLSVIAQRTEARPTK